MPANVITLFYLACPGFRSNAIIEFAEQHRKVRDTKNAMHGGTDFQRVMTGRSSGITLRDKENVHLKKLIADSSLDNPILKDAAEGNFYALNTAG